MYIEKNHPLSIVGNPDTLRGATGRIICSAGEFQIYNQEAVLIATSSSGKRLGYWAFDLGCHRVVYDYDLGLEHGR